MKDIRKYRHLYNHKNIHQLACDCFHWVEGNPICVADWDRVRLLLYYLGHIHNKKCNYDGEPHD